MANTYVQFALEFNINQKAIPWAVQLLGKAFATDGDDTDDDDILAVFPSWNDRQCLGFDWDFGKSVYRKREYTTVVISDGGGEGNPYMVACFIQAYLKKYAPKKRIGFSFAETSSRSRLDGFGGGAYLVTAKRMTSMSTFAWLNKQHAR